MLTLAHRSIPLWAPAKPVSLSCYTVCKPCPMKNENRIKLKMVSKSWLTANGKALKLLDAVIRSGAMTFVRLNALDTASRFTGPPVFMLNKAATITRNVGKRPIGLKRLTTTSRYRLILKSTIFARPSCRPRKPLHKKARLLSG